MGDYLLKLKGIGRRIKLQIHKGQFWENDSFILKRNCLFENMQAQQTIKIASVGVEENKQGTSDVHIKLSDYTEDTRVHCFASQFEQESTQQLALGIRELMREKFDKTTFSFAMWKNIFLSNRELGDEFRYVFDRKYAERHIGSSLDRPKLVLKRNFV